MSGYDGYYDSCGGSCGSGCNPGYNMMGYCGGEYKATSPDYNPVTVNNTTTPNVEGSSAQGGYAYGNNSNICVSMGGSSCNSQSDCCREGAKDLLQFLASNALNPDVTSISAFVYGNVLPPDLTSGTNNLLDLDSAALSNLCVSDQTVSSVNGVVSLCSIKAISFTLAPDTQISTIKETFKYVKNCSCSCSCECGDGIAEALCVYGLGRAYTLTLDVDNLPVLTNYPLVAVSNNIAIFSIPTTPPTPPTQYVGIPTCNIAKFTV